MSDYAFFEYQAKLTNTGHAENEGELVHCMIRMKNVDRNGKRLHDIELHQQAEDDVLFVINPDRTARLTIQYLERYRGGAAQTRKGIRLPSSRGLRDLFPQR